MVGAMQLLLAESLSRPRGIRNGRFDTGYSSKHDRRRPRLEHLPPHQNAPRRRRRRRCLGWTFIW
jgi:hypothetical protein